MSAKSPYDELFPYIKPRQAGAPTGASDVGALPANEGTDLSLVTAMGGDPSKFRGRSPLPGIEGDPNANKNLLVAMGADPSKIGTPQPLPGIDQDPWGNTNLLISMGADPKKIGPAQPLSGPGDANPSDAPQKLPDSPQLARAVPPGLAQPKPLDPANVAGLMARANARAQRLQALTQLPDGVSDADTYLHRNPTPFAPKHLAMAQAPGFDLHQLAQDTNGVQLTALLNALHQQDTTGQPGNLNW
jgi:hypothetical protein